VLRELEVKTQTRLRNFIVPARTLLGGDRAASVAAVIRVVDSGFRDPESRFYGAPSRASRIGGARAGAAPAGGGNGFFCSPVMERDSWLDSLRKKPAFTKLMRSAEAQHRKTSDAFERLEGTSVLSMRSYPPNGAEKARTAERQVHTAPDAERRQCQTAPDARRRGMPDGAKKADRR